MMAEPILKVRNLTTPLKMGNNIYNVVDNVSFDLHLGKTLALVGESGCGKSMTALSIMRILPTPPCLPSQGEVIYKGQNLLKIPEKKMRDVRGARIAMIFQDPGSALNPVYTIGSQLIEVAELHLKIYGEEAFNRCVRALDEVGIPAPDKRMYDYPHQMSGGMKQRVMIAMGLMCEPDILIADEPTTALDVTIQKQVLELMKSLQKKMGMAILLITHDMGIVAEMADEVNVMYTSQTVERGNVFDIFDRMAHPYTIGLFNSRPDLKNPRGELKPIKGTVPPISNYPSGCRFHTRCPFVMEKCKQEVIPSYAIGDHEHLARCLLYDGSEESQQRLQEVKV
jgi:peptide/nickel transport system ATP-binding protein